MATNYEIIELPYWLFYLLQENLIIYSHLLYVKLNELPWYH